MASLARSIGIAVLTGAGTVVLWVCSVMLCMFPLTAIVGVALALAAPYVAVRISSRLAPLGQRPRASVVWGAVMATLVTTLVIFRAAGMPIATHDAFEATTLIGVPLAAFIGALVGVLWERRRAAA